MRKITLDDGSVRFEVMGQLMTEEEFDRAFAPEAPDPCSLIGWKPLVSDALAVHPKQVKEATDDAEKKGVPTEFRRDGRPIFRTREHRKRYMQKYGFFDKAGGYGDAQPGQTKRDIPPQPDPRTLY